MKKFLNKLSTTGKAQSDQDILGTQQSPPTQSSNSNSLKASIRGKLKAISLSSHLLNSNNQKSSQTSINSYQSSKTKLPSNNFGVPLKTLLEQEFAFNQTGIPLLVQKLAEFLSDPINASAEGIMRLSAATKNVVTLRETIDKGDDDDYYIL